jgi:UDP-glucose 4-epimerase
VMRVLVTGSAGFIGGYVVEELLSRGYEVVGLDNLSKYGPVVHTYDSNPRFRSVIGDARDVDLLVDLLDGCEHLIAGAAMVGGIAYFHRHAYDLLASNERIIAATCDAAIRARSNGALQKVTYVSSSMVFESTDRWPSVEGEELRIAPPRSSYGFQKLAVEYFARAAYDQYGLPYSIVRPFNCVGTGERRALTDKQIQSGNVTLGLSHVVPDLVRKILLGQDPLHILGDGDQVRHLTYGGDLAVGIVSVMEHPAALNEDFNLSSVRSISVLELAELIWRRIRGPHVPFRYVSDQPFPHDVRRRIPATDKARTMLGFEATTSLESMLDEVIPWIEQVMREDDVYPAEGQGIAENSSRATS